MIFALAITGPTASGKTALSLGIAEKLSAEIISCDSMQIYKGMDIGTAKATADERALVPHHMIDFLSPTESYSVEEYRVSAIACVKDISFRGKLPVFVGGTGLYIDSVGRRSAQDAPESDPEYAQTLLREIDGADASDILWERLRTVDPESAQKIHKNNIRRVIRALEIYDKTGRTKSELDLESLSGEREVFVGMITIDFHNRELLYQRIDSRVDQMIDMGLLAEVESLYKSGVISSGTASAAIGYKEIIEYLEGKATLDDAIAKLKLNSRRYAKRQLTWFRRESGARVIYADNLDGSLKQTNEMISEGLVHYENLRAEYKQMKGDQNNES